MVPVQARSGGANERAEEEPGGQTPFSGHTEPFGHRVPGMHPALENCTRRLEAALDRTDDDTQSGPVHEDAVLRTEEEEQKSPEQEDDTLRADPTETAEEPAENREDCADAPDEREEEHCEPMHGRLDDFGDDETAEPCDIAELFGGGHWPFAEHTWPSGHNVPGVQETDDDTLDSAPQDDGGQAASIAYCWQMPALQYGNTAVR